MWVNIVQLFEMLHVMASLLEEVSISWGSGPFQKVGKTDSSENSTIIGHLALCRERNDMVSNDRQSRRVGGECKGWMKIMVASQPAIDPEKMI